MKRPIYLLTALLLWAILPAHAQNNLFAKYAERLTLPKNYVCYRTTDKMKIDGQLNEKAWQKAANTDSFVDISGEGFAQPKFDTKVKMLWDDNYLYVGATLAESDIKARLTQRDTIIYHDNDFEVFLDPDGDGHNYFEIENNARGVIFDLMLDKTYRCGGNFMIQWDCPGLILKVHHQGTLNKPGDQDKAWTVEMAIPHKALTVNFNNPLKAGNTWRVNFSRVQWLKAKGPEENWVWTPTGKIDMHMPERWGFVYFSANTVGGATDTFSYPYHMGAYKLAWAMFYAQQDYYAKERNYIRAKENFFLTDAELKGLPEHAEVNVEATANTFLVSVSVPQQNVRYVIDNEGRFSVVKIAPRFVKNWVWTRIDKNKSPESYKKWFTLLKECGISAVLFEGYEESLFKMCKEAGLEAHYWKWTMNRRELLNVHPDWYAVNRKGESGYDKPAYVDYYRFLCPNHEGVADYLAQDYVKEANLPYVDGVHLDYVRFPDVVLPVSLWKNYNIEQTSELPQYDYCYCDVCRAKFKAQTGKDPLEIKFPMEDQSWINFRLDAITHVVDHITKAIKADGKSISAAVFPGPSMARKMVRQDWGNWHLDAYFPMIYNGFYYEGPEWIGRSVKESVQTVNGKAKIYAGLMFPDIKKDFEKALDEAYDNGASGVSFFDGPSEEYLYKLKDYLQKRGYQVAK
ncbi:MAG: sugar-binding protein [Bacteroides sp.]